MSQQKIHDESSFKRILKAYNSPDTSKAEKEFIEFIFPELKESEDEKIKKELIGYFTGWSDKHLFRGFKAEQILAWLEKQGEQNNLLNFDEAEKEKNDFVSGQFVECRKSFNEFKELESYWFEYIGDDIYIGRSDNILNQRFHITPQQLFTLFTHQHCPKDNENQCEQKSVDADEPKFKVGDIITPKDGGHEPWQIMQVDTLDKKYRFKDGYVIHFSQEDDYELVEQKPDWSEEDEKMCSQVINEIEAIKSNSSTIFEKNIAQDKIDWLKSIKDRVHPKQELGKEDSERLDRIYKFIWANRKGDTDEIYQLEQDADWLESLPLRINIQQKQEWSEKDETMLSNCISLLLEIDSTKEERDWLKSLKPQSKKM